MLEHFDIWKFFAGLGIFMFGMFLLEESIKQLSVKAFKRFIRKTTTGKIRSIFTGILTTSVLQSSSAVSLMTLALAGAGIISMPNAIGLIMGTNVGTTFTGWIVATFGFKMSIEAISLPAIGIGGLGLIFFGNSPKYSGVSKLLVGIGFLFMGIDYMKTSVEELTDNIQLEDLPHYGTWSYVFIGFFLTALMQSSSASLAIILTALNAKILFFSEGAAMVIGANLGTTITILLGAIGGVQIKKQVALSHFIFNFVTGVVAFALLPFFLQFIIWLEAGDHNDVLGIALFHTLFNILGILIFFPFINKFVEILSKIYPDKTHEVTQYINNVSHDLSEAAIQALKNETEHLLKETIILGKLIIKNDELTVKKGSLLSELNILYPKAGFSVEEQYEKIQILSKAIAVYAANIKNDEIEPTDSERLHHFIHASLMLSQVCKLFMSLRESVDEMEGSSKAKVRELLKLMKNNNHQFWDNLIQMITDENATIIVLNELEDFENYYKKYIEILAKELSQGNIEEKHTSALLTLNGMLTRCNRHMYQAVCQLKEIDDGLLTSSLHYTSASVE